MKDLISIIIPCFNASQTISRTLKSLREQDYKKLEVIIINDGSTDNSLEIISKYQQFDNRIKVFSQKNMGVSVARNKGLELANGDYIIFLDADDNYTSPFAISKMMDKLKQHDADMVVCNFIHPCFEIIMQGEHIFNMENDNDFLKFYQDFFIIGVPWNKIIKKSCLTEKFIEGVKFNEDELFNLDNLHNFKKIVFIDEVLHNYYCAPNSSSAVNSIYSSENFWENKSTIWHLGMKNQELRIKSLTKFYPNKKSELQYVRSFDFFFWDFCLMLKNNVKKEYILHTCKTIFETQLFQQSLKHKERYGLKLQKITDKQIVKFINLARHAFIDIKSGNKTLSTIRVLLCLFYHCFFKAQNNLNPIDTLANAGKEFETSTSAEAFYSNFLVQMFKNKEIF